MTRLSKVLIAAGAAVANAQDSDLHVFAQGQTDYGDSDYGNGKDGLTCNAKNLRTALRKANYLAEDVALCHRDLLAEDTEIRLKDGDQCDQMIYDEDRDSSESDHMGFLACPVSIYMRAKPMTFINNNPEVVLCCWQLGYSPDWVLGGGTVALQNAFQAAEASDPFEPLDDDDNENSDRRELQADAPRDFYDPSKRAWPKWEPLKTKAEWEAFKVKLLEQEKESVYETMAKRVLPAPALDAQGSKGKLPRKMDDSSNDAGGSDDHTENGKDYDCNNYWGLRQDLLMAFDYAPIGWGALNDAYGKQDGFPEYERDHRRRRREVVQERRRRRGGIAEPASPPSAPPSAPPAPPRNHQMVRIPGAAACQEGNCRATNVFWPSYMYQGIASTKDSFSSTNTFSSSTSIDFDLDNRLYHNYVAVDHTRSLCVDGLLNRYDASWVMAVLARSGALQCCMDQPGLAMNDMDFDLEEFIITNFYTITERFYDRAPVGSKAHFDDYTVNGSPTEDAPSQLSKLGRKM